MSGFIETMVENIETPALPAAVRSLTRKKKKKNSKKRKRPMLKTKINELFDGLEYVRTYIYDLLIISNKSFEDHINKLDKVLGKLNQKGFKVNAKSPFLSGMN